MAKLKIFGIQRNIDRQIDMKIVCTYNIYMTRNRNFKFAKLQKKTLFLFINFINFFIKIKYFSSYLNFFIVF